MANDNPEGLAKLLIDDLYEKISYVIQHREPTIKYVDHKENNLHDPEDLIFYPNIAVKFDCASETKYVEIDQLNS